MGDIDLSELLWVQQCKSILDSLSLSLIIENLFCTASKVKWEAKAGNVYHILEGEPLDIDCSIIVHSL